MEKFSVIVPTIWKGEQLFELLDKLYACENVCEVILINNNRTKTPDFKRHEKLICVEPDTNIYCNPAWNMGVRMAKSTSVMIVQDDVLFDVDTFINTLITIHRTQVKFEDLGIVGMHTKNYTLDYDSGVVLENIKITPIGEPHGWACIMAFHTNWWTPIPDDLKIWYGDDFIRTTGRRLFDFYGLPVKGKMSTSADTSVDWVNKVVEADGQAWGRIRHEMYQYMLKNQN